MQKYINIVFILALVFLGFYIVRLQVFSDLKSVQLEVNNQAQLIQTMRTDITNITNFLNQQIQAQQEAANQ
ncbi:hypothetical protein KKG71_05665 [Patescibacteria group bacterium]|nr:hypothetical protein [Patescibacteria group bacterium]